MTYCLGILLPAGLILASDSRSNAGVDQVAKVRKLETFAQTGERMVAILSAGNLATTQWVVSSLKEEEGDTSLRSAKSMFEVAKAVGALLREVTDRDAKYVTPFGDPSASFILGGQIKERRRVCSRSIPRATSWKRLTGRASCRWARQSTASPF